MQKLELCSEKFLFNNVEFIPSPNHDERPQGCEIDLLVIHCISLPPKQFGSSCVADFFVNQLDFSAHPFFKTIKNLKVSTHLYIERDGTIIQFVPFNQRAWHAGESSFKGRSSCNDYSIGIELEGDDDIPFTQEQYNSLISCTVKLLHLFPKLNLDRIVGHSDIAPGRKTDPGSYFDWAYYKNQLIDNIPDKLRL